MRQIHFDINFGNFCCRIKNSFEKSERDPHLGKQLSYSDINTFFSNSLYFFNVLTQKVSLFADTAVSNLQFVVSERHQLAVAGEILVFSLFVRCAFMDVGGWSTHSQDCLSFQIIVWRVATPACWQKRHTFGLKSCLFHRSLTQECFHRYSIHGLLKR